MKKILLLSVVLVFGFVSCDNKEDFDPNDPSVIDAGVVINDVRWATRNVCAPGTFADNPEDAGMFYQWNRRRAWNTINIIVSGWNREAAGGPTWTAASDPCPPGWRVPTEAEIRSLHVADREWAVKNGIVGLLFGAAPNQIFLPAVGVRSWTSGMLEREYADYYKQGVYWSSERNRVNAWRLHFAVLRLDIVDGFDIDPDPDIDLPALYFRSMREDRRATGASVRCVAR